MLIKEIKFKNMQSNEEEIALSFVRKIKENDKYRFIKETIEKKPRSEKSRQGTIKTLALFGKNASYKTSILTSINKILDFIINFKKNAEELNENDVDIDKAIIWYEETNGIDPFEDDISFTKVVKEYLKNVNKNIKPEDLKNNYSKFFYKKNSFNKDKPIIIMVNFYDTKINKDIIINISLINKRDKLIFSSTMNGKSIDLFKENSINILNFKHDFASFENYNINGRQIFLGRKQNIFLRSALEYLFFEKYDENIEKLSSFLKILDPSIISVQHKFFKKKKRLKILGITREYGDVTENIQINKLSSGTQIFITYLYFILKNDFIIIDELEQSLHFKLIELLLDISRENRKQLIYSTHSPIIIEKLSRKYELYISEFNSKNELELKRGDKIFRERDNFIVKYLNDLVSNIDDVDLDTIKMDLYD